MNGTSNQTGSRKRIQSRRNIVFMKTLFLWLLLIVCFSANAQFVYKRTLKPPPPTPARTDSVMVVDSTKPGVLIKVADSTKRGTPVVPAAGNDQSCAFLFAGGSGESIAVAEFLAGTIGTNGGRLAFGGTVTKATQSSTGDLKALLQGGGNFFLSHSFQFAGVENPDIGYYMLLWRGKIGAVLPALGSATNVLQAHFDPGLEAHFKLIAKNGADEAIAMVAAIRLGCLWASKEYSENLQLTTNFLPYLYVTGGIRLKNTVQILFSQQFFNKKKLTGTATMPAASLGLSVVL
jgi:hypothetical protein